MHSSCEITFQLNQWKLAKNKKPAFVYSVEEPLHQIFLRTVSGKSATDVCVNVIKLH